ncbi:hypothetical protein Ae706Ps2_0632 [Pseudonocardia sp. Ae706_Ps2]|nr:hypothetical protein Ae331Ps2_5292c [Pseudonocardia sp. Ae331_Ps2]OLM14769.1 hypothetical protein Ae505Ps2_4900c [Pseudonocardia sp. Ae505_Ps2]OLM14773.1 hypothetical protein Ae505Ps2_4904c [Pseudonocardia sp. Ae505_Ps2]OLM22200.1 hypothetical protein Ae706Ps2_0632 [Pseudonocardia sp. Ae706_Ps2]
MTVTESGRVSSHPAVGAGGDRRKGECGMRNWNW